MKKIILKLPTATIVLIILAIFFGIWGADQMIANNRAGEVVIVAVDDGNALSENEGENILTTGKLSVLEAPVDNKTGVTVDGLVLVRTVEMYQYYTFDDSVYRGFSAIQRDDIEGEKGEKYINPDFPDECKNALFFSNATIGNGGLVVDESLLEALYRKSSLVENSVDKVDIENLEIEGFKPCGEGYYTSTNANADDWQIGDIRIKYSYIPEDSLNNVTVVGLQQDGKIIPSESYISCISDSEKTVDDIVSQFTGDYKQGMKTCWGIGGVLLAVGIVIAILKRKVNKEV